MLTEKNSKIKQLEDQLAKQRDYEQIKHELKYVFRCGYLNPKKAKLTENTFSPRKQPA